MTDILERDLKPSPDTVEASVGDETVLLHRERGVYFGLDSVGTRVWSLLKKGNRPLDICRSIAEEFEVDRAKVDEDVRKYLIDLKSHDLIVE